MSVRCWACEEEGLTVPVVLRFVLVHEPDPTGREEGQAARALRRAGLGLELGGCQVLGE